jgi:hypothetical protein
MRRQFGFRAVMFRNAVMSRSEDTRESSEHAQPLQSQPLHSKPLHSQPGRECEWSSTSDIRVIQISAGRHTPVSRRSSCYMALLLCRPVSTGVAGKRARSREQEQLPGSTHQAELGVPLRACEPCDRTNVGQCNLSKSAGHDRELQQVMQGGLGRPAAPSAGV